MPSRVNVPPSGLRHGHKTVGRATLYCMKKIFLMAALVLSGLVAKAQVEPGTFTLMPKVGLNMATMTGGEDTKMKAGAVAGVEAEYRATDLIGVSAGLLYSM